MDCHNFKVALQRGSPPSCMVWYWDPCFTDMDLGTDHTVHAPRVQKSCLWARDNQHSTHNATLLPAQEEETWGQVGG